MRYRPHRGTLADAMAECVELPSTMEALRAHIAGQNYGWLDPDTIEVQPYSDRPDYRIGWERTYIVMATWRDGVRLPVGFTDAMPVTSDVT